MVWLTPPSQCSPVWKTGTIRFLATRLTFAMSGLNVVRSGRPEQWRQLDCHRVTVQQSQCSPVWKTGTIGHPGASTPEVYRSQCSPVWKTGTIPVPTRMVSLTLSSQCSPVWKTGTMFPMWVCGNRSRPYSLNVVRSGRPEQ